MVAAGPSPLAANCELHAPQRKMEPSTVLDHLSTMKCQESRSYYSLDYLTERHQPVPDENAMDISNTDGVATDPVRSIPPSVDAVCRGKMCEWFYQVVDYCRLNRDTVAYAMSYIDRFLGTNLGKEYLHDRTLFQLVAVTAFYTAIKLHEPVEIDISLLSALSRGCYTVAQIAEMEGKMLSALEWKMNPPLSTAFVELLLCLMPNEVNDNTASDVYEVAKYQIELSVTDYTFTKNSASEVAMASLLNAVEHMHSSRLSKEACNAFSNIAASALGTDVNSADMCHLRRNLLSIFAKSRGYELQETLQLCPNSASGCGSNNVAVTRKENGSHNSSPICVSRRSILR